MSFCRQLLGVRKQTNTAGVLQELGMLPLTLYASRMAVRNWGRIHLNEANSLLIASYNCATRKELPWVTSIKNIFANNGLLETYLLYVNSGEGKVPSAANILFKRLADQFNQTAMENIKESSKLKTLSLLKHEVGREPYLTEITNPRHRQDMTKLRLSSHRLEIERGRYTKPTKTPPEERICTYCKSKGINVVEDEAHFLLDCPMSRELRDKYSPQEILNNNGMSSEEKLIQILSNSDLKLTAKFISQSFEHREITLDVLNTLDDLTKNVENLIIDQTSGKQKNPNVYCIKNISSDGLKIVFSQTSEMRKKTDVYCVKNTSSDGLKMVLSRLGGTCK